MQFDTKKERAPVNPNGRGPCPPFNDGKRSEVAVCVFNAVRAAGASVAVQLVAGDLAYCGKRQQEIEFVVINTGGTQSQAAAAAAAVGSTKFEVLPVAWKWWELGRSHGENQLDNYVKNRNNIAALKQFTVNSSKKRGWWPFSWPIFY